MSIILALILFSVIVIFHEFGHFLLAKKNGIGVTEFSVGMGPRIISFEKGETRYSLKLLPFGGSCMMVGEDSISDPDNMNAENSFNSKSVWARISVIAAGPIFNFILAFVFALILIGNIGYDRAAITDVMEGFPADEAGLMAGDVITEMNGKNIVIYRDVSLYIAFHQGETIDLVYERDGVEYETTIVPKYSEENNTYLMGVTYSGERVKGSALDTIKYSAYEVKYWINYTIKSVGMIFKGQVSTDDLSGPVGIVDMIDDSYEQSKTSGAYAVFLNMLYLSILLSANLGVMNLLPIPALDGGRLVFLIIEAVRGKPVDREKEGIVHFAGLMLLMALMVFVMFNDIKKIFF